MATGKLSRNLCLNVSLCSSGLIGAVFSLLQFLSSPITGALSDRYGRRPLLLLTTVSGAPRPPNRAPFLFPD